MWKVYLEALVQSFRLPRAMTYKVCRKPKTCGKSHRFAVVTDKFGRASMCLVHLE